MSVSKKAKAQRKGAAPTRSSRRKEALKNPHATRRPAWSPAPRPINAVWWCGVNPQGCPVWPFLDVTKSNVAELLTSKEGPYWAERGWRIAKLQVTEITLSSLNPSTD